MVTSFGRGIIILPVLCAYVWLAQGGYPVTGPQEEEGEVCLAAQNMFQVTPTDPNYMVKLDTRTMPSVWGWYTQPAPLNLISSVGSLFPKPYHAFFYPL